MVKESVLKRALRTKVVGLLVLTVLLCFVIWLLKPGFIKSGNIRGVLNNMCVQGTMIAGIACLLISGAIDLSSGAQAALGSLVFAQLLSSFPDLPWSVALVVALGFGALAGCVNIFLTNVLNFMPFIATIGMSSIYSGLGTVWTKGNTVPVSAQGFTNFGKMAIFGSVPVLFAVMAALIVVYSVMLAKTRFGRNIYMVGGNRDAARLAGVDPKKIHAALYINNSVLAVFAGCVWVAQKKLASPTNIVTSAPDMSAITSSILGGVAFMGGAGTLAGAFVGMVLLNVFDNALTILKVPNYWNIAAQGLMLIAALILDSLGKLRSRK
jgi:ribose/xylose/arabinose/galactoside ABC-type transport system permease subunit